MQRKAILTVLAIASTLSAAAQVLVNDGFYRVQNYGSKRYVYVYDNTGKINANAASVDMGAIVLYKDADRRLSDPASVIYISGKGKNSNGTAIYDLETQGTGVHKIINYYVTVREGNVKGTFWVLEPTYNYYLWDAITSTYYDRSHMDVKGGAKTDYRCWSISAVNAKTDEYLGITPSANLKLGDKYYYPYYLGFAMDFASAGMKAYYVSDVKSDAVIIKEVVGTVPAATPVIVECNGASTSDNRVNLYASSPAKISDNKLTGNYFCYADHGETAYKKYDPSTMRLLAVKDGKLCYITDTANEYTTLLEINGAKNYYIPANSSYLPVPAGTAASLPVMTQAEYDALHPATKKGDVNGDGQVNGTDAAVLYRTIAAGKSAKDAPQADINGDGAINGTDAAVLYRIIAAGK